MRVGITTYQITTLQIYLRHLKPHEKVIEERKQVLERRNKKVFLGAGKTAQFLKHWLLFQRI